MTLEEMEEARARLAGFVRRVKRFTTDGNMVSLDIVEARIARAEDDLRFLEVAFRDLRARNVEDEP